MKSFDLFAGAEKLSAAVVQTLEVLRIRFSIKLILAVLLVGSCESLNSLPNNEIARNYIDSRSELEAGNLNFAAAGYDQVLNKMSASSALYELILLDRAHVSLRQRNFEMALNLAIPLIKSDAILVRNSAEQITFVALFEKRSSPNGRLSSTERSMLLNLADKLGKLRAGSPPAIATRLTQLETQR